MICPSCGEFITTDDPKTCPFCGLDVQHFAFPASRSYGVTSKSTSPFTPNAVVIPAGAQVSDTSRMEFKRPSGFSDSGPRRYIDKRLPRCPFCRTNEPAWEYAEVKGWLNRANFRCQQCHGVLSVPLDVLTPWKNPGSLLGGLGSSEYMRIEWVGDSPGLEAAASRVVGGEFSLERLRNWANRPGAELPVSAS